MRIYFDKQIFSHLFKGEKESYVKLLDKILISKQNHIYCYSHAHLEDLKNDKTEIKYEELKFIEKIVDDNYLQYDSIKKETLYYLAKPIDAFKDLENSEENLEINLSNIFDEIDYSILDSGQIQQIEFAKKIIQELKFDFNFIQLQNVPEEISSTLKKILPIDSEPMNLFDLSQKFMDTNKLMEEDKNVYKGLRNISDKYLNNGKFTVEYDNIDFNNEMKNSILQKTFIDFVNSNLNPNGDKEVTRYDFFNSAYFSLDLLGISKEPTKSVKYRNVLNDGLHSFYGAYCDIVVSDDNGFLKKTKALYRLLNIETKVLHIDEFINTFTFTIDGVEKDFNNFLSLLLHDLENAIIINTKKSIKYNRITIELKPTHNYLGHFNRIDQMIEDNISYIYLYKKIINYSSYDFYREIEIIVNNCYRLFGLDFNGQEKFSWEIDKKELEINEWSGRFWDKGEFTLLLDINVGTNKIGLLLTKK
ncbi:hypothetical protein [Empedobacter sp.]|uniref:hypothetical protein n=1 Tax=Empedobacter sp. TaxID=1927715 RepID=UPI0028A2DB16|nr:hypothetical protein [Empedobacter sp.]